MDFPSGLPDRSVLLEKLTEMIDSGESPGMFAISIDGFDDLPRRGEADGGDDVGMHAMTELAGRLSRLVRSNDILAVLAPGVFALAGAGVDQVEADAVLERVRGVFAMPVEVDGVMISLPVTVGVSHAEIAGSARELVDLAERDLQEKLDG